LGLITLLIGIFIPSIPVVIVGAGLMLVTGIIAMTLSRRLSGMRNMQDGFYNDIGTGGEFTEPVAPVQPMVGGKCTGCGANATGQFCPFCGGTVR
ncbi:MAG: hypothetical protein FWD89_04850, partial [Firmicutes bacterium]|nr:hypothetical protein [Bacillota bacterium]